MAEMDVATASVGTIAPTRAAWLATAIGIPVYGATALIASDLAAPLLAAFGDEPEGPTVSGLFVGTAVVNVLIALFGIMLVAHSIGRAVFARTRDMTPSRAGAAFAMMASSLAIIPVAVLAFAQSQHVVGAVYAAIAVGLPCGFTAGLTRAVLPGVAASPTASRLAGGVAAGAVLVIVAWTAVVLFGVGR